ncbi:MAG: hypothetical protein QNJ84_10695 [Alphaproteobacteria bacterium]|nr:hypothetical protein [Alphaproteobacteria bacterium]
MTDTPPIQTAPPTLKIDYEKYLRFLEHTEMSDTEKIACIDAHWRVICEFVKLGFNIHPVQVAEKACGKRAKHGDERASQPENAVHYLRHHILENHSTGAGTQGALEREES